MLGDVTQQPGGGGQEEVYSYKVTFNYFPGGVKPKTPEPAAAAKAPAPRPKKASSDSME